MTGGLVSKARRQRERYYERYSKGICAYCSKSRTPRTHFCEYHHLKKRISEVRTQLHQYEKYLEFLDNEKRVH